MRASVPFFLVSIVAPTLAVAAPRLLPGEQHQPPVYLDVPATWVNAVSHDSNGYGVKAFLRVAGATSKGDRLRFDWRSGGKLVASGPCHASWRADEQAVTGACELDKDVKATGQIELDVIYTDDQTDTDYLVTTLKVEVRNWKEIGKSQSWGLIADDLLAVAFVRHWDSTSADRAPLIQFWSSNGGLHGQATMRCTVDGKKLPDFEAHLDSAHHGTDQSTIQSSFTAPKVSRTYTYQHYELNPGFRFGPMTAADKKLSPEVRSLAADNPGAWDCVLRKDGKPLRQFQFKVDASGMIAASDMQAGKRTIRTLSNVVLIDMRIPADNGLEKRLRPEAMRRSIGFGVPWPDHAKAKELQAAFPGASGTPD